MLGTVPQAPHVMHATPPSHATNHLKHESINAHHLSFLMILANVDQVQVQPVQRGVTERFLGGCQQLVRVHARKLYHHILWQELHGRTQIREVTGTYVSGAPQLQVSSGWAFYGGLKCAMPLDAVMSACGRKLILGSHCWPTVGISLGAKQIEREFSF